MEKYLPVHKSLHLCTEGLRPLFSPVLSLWMWACVQLPSTAPSPELTCNSTGPKKFSSRIFCPQENLIRKGAGGHRAESVDINEAG